MSYFDHDLPNFSRDGIISAATGLTAQPDTAHTRTDFPAYWNTGLRQYLYYDGHNGYDFNLWYQPVYAAAPGKVIFAAFEYPASQDHGYGQMIMIDHRNGYVTLYGHFSRLLVHKGQRVKRGQEIGISGNTGHSSGPHLHFTVFHNCSPTDPYGWTGSGDDPLQSYQGETSSYLWRSVPLVANPIPGLPGSRALPPAEITRIALLRLPSTRAGTRKFTRDLAREARRVVTFLRKEGVDASADLLRGALLVTSAVSPEQLYAAPDVVSLATPDTEGGARSDVEAALARASLADKHARLRVARSSTWTGYLLHWQGQTFLVGKGERGKEVDLRVEDPNHRVVVHHLRADPSTGAYAVNLGRMSPRQRAQLERELEGRGSGGASIRVVPKRRSPNVAPVRPADSRIYLLLPVFDLLALLAAVFSLLPSTLRREPLG